MTRGISVELLRGRLFVWGSSQQPEGYSFGNGWGSELAGEASDEELGAAMLEGLEASGPRVIEVEERDRIWREQLRRQGIRSRVRDTVGMSSILVSLDEERSIVHLWANMRDRRGNFAPSVTDAAELSWPVSAAELGKSAREVLALSR